MENVLEQGKIRLTQSSSFNDPFELLTYIESIFSPKLFEKSFGSIKKTDDIDENFFNESMKMVSDIFTTSTLKHEIELSHMLRQQFDKQFGILSLTKNYENIVMWSHYANDHTGFVIGINDKFWKPNINKFINLTFKELLKVSYLKQRPQYKSLIDEDLFDVENEEIFENFYKTILSTKSLLWKHEKEYRIIADFKGGIDSGHLDKYGNNIYLFDLPPENIATIILGVLMKQEDENKMLSLLKQKRYSHVKIYKAELDKMEYKLNFKQIVNE